MTTSHTPGPWSWVEGPTEDESASLVSADGSEICSFGSYGSAHDQTAGWEPNETDKALIAAAPEMLEVLKVVQIYLQNPEYSEYLIDMVDGIISEAEYKP